MNTNTTNTSNAEKTSELKTLIEQKSPVNKSLIKKEENTANINNNENENSILKEYYAPLKYQHFHDETL